MGGKEYWDGREGDVWNNLSVHVLACCVLLVPFWKFVASYPLSPHSSTSRDFCIQFSYGNVEEQQLSHEVVGHTSSHNGTAKC